MRIFSLFFLIDEPLLRPLGDRFHIVSESRDGVAPDEGGDETHSSTNDDAVTECPDCTYVCFETHDPDSRLVFDGPRHECHPGAIIILLYRHNARGAVVLCAIYLRKLTPLYVLS